MATVRANAQLDATWRGGSATRAASRDINDLDDKSKKASTGFGGLSKAAGLAVAGFAAAGTAAMALGRGLAAVTSLAAEQQRVEAQLAATLESTGHAAGMSAEELKKLAGDLQTMTTYGDEAIIASESLLLTFTQIGRNTFPRAQTAILDMATAMGTDLKAATIQVGKALNDPIKGVSALAEAGIQFSDAQKEMIATMVETGDTAGAQALILKELETQFGGSAAAAADTFGGRMTQLQNIIGDVGEEIGNQLLPAMKTIAEEAGPAILDAVRELNPEIENFGDWMVAAADAVVPLIRNLSTFIQVGQTSGRIARGITTLGLSELYRWLRNTETAQNDLNDAVREYPPYATNAARAALAEAEELEALNRQLEFNSQRGRTATVQTVELGSAMYDTQRAADGLIRSTSGLTDEQIEANRQYLIGLRVIPRFGDSMQRMADAHEQFEPAANAATGAMQREAAAVEQLWQGFQKLNPSISAGFVEAMDLTDGKLTSLQEATQNADGFILNLATTLGATGEELGYLATTTGEYTQAQIDAAVKAIEFEKRLAALKQKFANGTISVYQFRDGVRDLIAEINGLKDKTVTVTVNTVENGQVVTNNAGGSAGLSEFDNGVPGRAMGGPVMSGKAYMVGEDGPEVFVPPMSGTIINNQQAGQALGSSVGTINVYVMQPNASPHQIASAVSNEIGRRTRG